MLTLSFWGADGLMITPETLTSGMVGAKIAFQYSEDWEGLNKTAVFMAGNTIRAVSNIEDTAEIPAEVLAAPGSRLYVGIYGESEDGTLVIPTICVAGPKIQYGADPLQAPAGEPPVTSYARLLTMIGDLTELKTEAKDSLVAALNEVFADGSNGSSADTGGNSGSNSTQNVNNVEPADDDIPKVFMTGDEFGDMTTAKNEVKMGLEYISKTDKFKAAIKNKFQGNTSLAFPKKNFTIKMYTDDTYETKLKKSFKDWNHSGNKYVLKANYVDHAHARNIISANLWSEVVASRPDYDSLPVEMRNSPRNGAVDGFPVKVYVNGTYQGIYTWNIGKDDWMWGMDEDNARHVLLCAETNTDGTYRATPCNFRALWSGCDGTDWSVEVGTNSTDLKTSLNNLIQFVMDNDGDDFRNGIGNYLDIQSAIDYYIFMYDICGLDGLAKNMLLATYDGNLWRCGAYDMDSTFGLWYNGSKFVSTTYACPEDYQEQFSLLWERIEANFLPELKARQAELRKTVLSYSNMVTHFERFMDIIGLDLYAEDLTIYTGIPSGSTNNIKQIRNFIRDRQAYVDAEFAAMTGAVPCTGVTLSADALTFTAEGTQTLTATVTPDGCTYPIAWESDNTSVATVSGGVVTAITNGSATITAKCGEYSATCAVTVSGIYESVPCTGITLDKTELVFTTKESQTITATVEPSDTTDEIVWSSNNQTVARVENGVVTAVSSGSAIITATCGSQSVVCAVSVEIPIDYTTDALSGVTWLEGQKYNDTTGELETATGEYCTPKLTLQNCMYNLTRTSGTYMRLYMWDENGVYVGSCEMVASASIGEFMANPNWQYAVKIYSEDAFDVSAVSLMPVDNTANAEQFTSFTVDSADCEWSDTYRGAETNVHEALTNAGFASIYNINKTNGHHVFFNATCSNNAIIYNDAPVFTLFTYSSQWLLLALDTTAEYAKASGWTLVLN